MYCAYALLLFPEESMRQQERLVVFGSDHPYSHYSIHKPQISGQFPEIDWENEIIKTKWQINGPGTYMRAYCSYTLPVLEIAQKIITGVDYLSNESHVDFGPTDGSDKRCLDQITRLQAERYKVHELTYNRDLIKAPVIKLSELRRTSACSDLAIVSLVHQRKITVTGKYDFDAPPNLSRLPFIDIDKPVQMTSVFSDNQFFGGLSNHIGLFAIAWYQGHLHAFLRKHEDNKWVLQTKVGEEKNNGRFICSILFGYFSLPRKFKSLIYSMSSNIDKPPTKLALLCSQCVNTQESRATKDIMNFDLELLPTIIPVGELSRD
ncbi:BgTH12-03023 [Blumeria graminis f. sp. triticale]|uniref:BgTH12-03023 n=1 Tax=Blumeria graminis f. sp. triticale TaxID=1689686 RepID=A0A9W4D7J3_BLUGR|nr:BgTH12-03023 [Blumeria graminis f. sp. triticale]